MRINRTIQPFLISLLLALLLVFVCALSACQPDGPSVLPDDSSVPAASDPSGSDPSEPDAPVSEPAEEKQALKSFGIETFEPSGELGMKSYTKSEADLKASYPLLTVAESASPFLYPPFLGDNGCFYTVLIHSLRKAEAEGQWQMDCRFFRLNADGTGWEQVDAYSHPEDYNRNSDNHNGHFFIEYGSNAQTGKPGPYAVAYQEYCEKEFRCILFQEKATEYARILRQNDDYAVLSLTKDDDRVYRVIDRTGRVLYTFNGEAAISECSPLTFYGDTLLCKTDTDDDFEYDTLEILHLEDGSKTAAASFGNCGRWMFSKNGEYVAAYDDEKAPTTLYLYHAPSGKTNSFACPGDPGETVIPECGVLLVKGTEGTAYSVWSMEGEVLASVPGGDDVSVAVSDSLFVFGSAQTVWIFDPSID